MVDYVHILTIVVMQTNLNLTHAVYKARIFEMRTNTLEGEDNIGKISGTFLFQNEVTDITPRYLTDGTWEVDRLVDVDHDKRFVYVSLDY